MDNENKNTLLIIFGWVSVVISLIVFPIVFVPVAIVLGGFLASEKFSHGMTIIGAAVLSLILAIVVNAMMYGGM